MQLHKSTVKIGFLGYRDFGDDDQFVVHDMTEKLDLLETLLKNVEAIGGGDEAEDVAGALELA